MTRIRLKSTQGMTGERVNGLVWQIPFFSERFETFINTDYTCESKGK